MKFLLGIVVGIALASGWQTRTAFVQVVEVDREESYDFRGVQFYYLRSNKGSVLCSGDPDTPLIQELQGPKRKLILSLEDVPR